MHGQDLTLCSCCLARGRQTKIRELEERLHDETELLETRQAELEQLEVTPASHLWQSRIISRAGTAVVRLLHTLRAAGHQWTHADMPAARAHEALADFFVGKLVCAWPSAVLAEAESFGAPPAGPLAPGAGEDRGQGHPHLLPVLRQDRVRGRGGAAHRRHARRRRRLRPLRHQHQVRAASVPALPMSHTAAAQTQPPELLCWSMFGVVL